MAFVLMLLVSITLLIQVETTNASRALDQLRARENARLGLMVGLGDLQKFAGQDERASTRYSAFRSSGSPMSNDQWVGIMDTQNPSSDPADLNWLVSSPRGSTSSPPTPLTGLDSITLVPALASTTLGIDEAAVSVPLFEIEPSEELFGYWVSDESHKASLTTRPLIDGQTATWLEDSFGATNASRLDQVIPKRAGLEMLFDSNGSNDATILNELGKIGTLEQIALSQSWTLNDYKYFFHDITSRSYGILASTTGTGLKDDFSLRPDLFPLAGSFESICDFEVYMETPLDAYNPSTPYIPFQDDLRRRYRIKAPTTTTDLEISDGIFPIITEFKILFHVHVAGSNVVNRTADSFQPILNSEEVVVRLQTHIELWNPYSSALVPENLVLEIQNLPDVTIELFDSSGDSVDSFTINLDDVLKNGSTGNDGFYIELPFTDRGFSNHDDFSWLPGRVYNWIGPNNYSNGNLKDTNEGFFYERNLGNGIWYTGTGLIAPSETSTIGLSGTAVTDLTVALRRKNLNGDTDTGNELLRVDNISYGSFSTGAGINKTSRGPRFGYQIQRDESGFVVLSSDPWDKSRWLRVEDPREPRPSFDDSGNGVGGFQAPNGLDPTGYTSTGISNAQFLFDRTMGGTGLRPSEDIPLFELFRQRPLSMGELQHLLIIGERPFTIGNSWGGEDGKRYNRIFDEGFFSGLNDTDTSPDLGAGEILPNHRLRTIAKITGSPLPELSDILTAKEDSSQLLVSEGSFNLNSTSARAWAAVLGSMYFENWEVANIDDDNGDIIASDPTEAVDVGQAILRFPQSAQEVYHTGDYRSTSEPPTEFFRLGAKHFEDSSGENDIGPYTDLGVAIAARVSERILELGPFVSVEEFLAPVEIDTFRDTKDATRNLSLLERAILDVAELNTSTQGNIWYHSSSFLSQADVMTGIAPIANVRGDTFVIRSAGVVRSPFETGDKIRVFCEATVQRIPETLDSSDNVLTPHPDGFGRRFIITSIRWLDQSEL